MTRGTFLLNNVNLRTLFLFLGVKAPLELAMVSLSVTKKFGSSNEWPISQINVKVSRDIKVIKSKGQGV